MTGNRRTLVLTLFLEDINPTKYGVYHHLALLTGVVNMYAAIFDKFMVLIV